MLNEYSHSFSLWNNEYVYTNMAYENFGSFLEPAKYHVNHNFEFTCVIQSFTMFAHKISPWKFPD